MEALGLLASVRQGAVTQAAARGPGALPDDAVAFLARPLPPRPAVGRRAEVQLDHHAPPPGLRRRNAARLDAKSWCGGP